MNPNALIAILPNDEITINRRLHLPPTAVCQVARRGTLHCGEIDIGGTGARILLGGANFGCGSSREHAVWALAEWGIACVLADSFAPIFRANCVRNGVLPITLPRPVIDELAGRVVTVDLAAQDIAGHAFAIDDEAKAMLLNGYDAIDLTLMHRNAIAAWQAADRAARPWIYLDKPA